MIKCIPSCDLKLISLSVQWLFFEVSSMKLKTGFWLSRSGWAIRALSFHSGPLLLTSGCSKTHLEILKVVLRGRVEHHCHKVHYSLRWGPQVLAQWAADQHGHSSDPLLLPWLTVWEASSLSCKGWQQDDLVTLELELSSPVRRRLQNILRGLPTPWTLAVLLYSRLLGQVWTLMPLLHLCSSQVFSPECPFL